MVNRTPASAKRFDIDHESFKARGNVKILLGTAARLHINRCFLERTDQLALLAGLKKASSATLISSVLRPLTSSILPDTYGKQMQQNHRNW
jgi:hypothetical protein